MMSNIIRFSDSSRKYYETNLAKEGYVPLSSIKDDTNCPKKDLTTEIIENSISDTTLDKSVLVFYDISNEASTTSNNMETEQQVVSNRLVIINNSRHQTGLDATSIKFFNKKNRKSTARTHDNGLRHYKQWRQNASLIQVPLLYNPNNVLQFLMDNKGYRTTHLNTLRTSITSIFNVLYNNKTSLAENSWIIEFFAAISIYNLRNYYSHQQFITHEKHLVR